ncbi:hypothetical protein NW752_008570 [Fusarium irregulare]|nr:hypothetical protein NW752_008570 [Fusarium irregulare]
MCTACIKSYLSNVTVEKEHFMHPFHAYKSIFEFADGAFLRKPGENAEEYDKQVKVVTDDIYKRLEGMDLLD